jgi:methionyl-tRNA formyltransferase
MKIIFIGTVEFSRQTLLKLMGLLENRGRYSIVINS